MGRQRKIICFAGGTGAGKSTLAEKMVTARCDKYNEPLIVLDPNNQQRWYHLPEITLEKFATWKSTSKGRYRIVTHDFEQFFDIVDERFRCGQIIAEEASKFCTPQLNRKLFGQIVSLRHPDHDVDITKIFHAVNRIPDYIIEQTHELVLLKTGDVWANCKDKFPETRRDEIEKIFTEVAMSEDPHVWRRITLRKTGTL